MKRLTTILLSGVLWISAADAQKSNRPNIILVLADDLGYADKGCYGQQKTETPNIDKLAKEGLKFTQFYSGTSVCAPSRVSLMTGLHTGHIPVRGNKAVKPEGQAPLPDSVITIANLLKQNGYTTAAFGKWGMGYITSTGAPDKKGFDTFYGYNCQSLAHNYYPDHLWNNDQRIDFPENLKAQFVYSADIIHQQAMQFLTSKKKEPFFAYLSYTLPHGDVAAPHDSIYQYYVNKFNEEPLKDNLTGNNIKSKSFEPYPHAAFAAMVSRLDKYVADIMTTLSANGTLENTLIIFTSDNGPHRENGGDPDFFDNNGIYRGIKCSLYEGGIRVPFIAYWKGKIKPGTTEQPAALWDLFPTFQQLSGMPVSKNIDGLSLLPVFLNQPVKQQHEYFYWEFHENKGRQALLWGKWKAVRLNVNQDDNSPLELYDLSVDPSEQKNIASQNPTVVKTIEQLMKQAHSPNKDWPLLKSEMNN
jgi:arylsulfatase A-like enzyme